MPDYMYMLESRLSAEQRAAMMRVQELAAAASANVYLTGGAVRDLISGAPIRDLDFTIEGNPARLVRELEKGGAQIVFEDERLRHVEMIFAGDCDGSLSAARDNVYARPGTTPEIRWSTIMEDLRCRDFSLNAIAISRALARPHQWAFRHWEPRNPRAFDSQFHESARAPPSRAAFRDAHGVQAGDPDGRVVLTGIRP